MPDAAARHGPDPDPGPDPVEPSGSHPTASGGDRTRSGGDRIRSGGDPIAELIAGMRQIGLDPDAEQLCDTLWLARWARPTDAVEGEEAGRGARRRPERR